MAEMHVSRDNEDDAHLASFVRWRTPDYYGGGGGVDDHEQIGTISTASDTNGDIRVVSIRETKLLLITNN